MWTVTTGTSLWTITATLWTVTTLALRAIATTLLEATWTTWSLLVLLLLAHLGGLLLGLGYVLSDLLLNADDLLTSVLAVLRLDLADHVTLEVNTRHAISQLLQVRNGVAVVVEHLVAMLIEVVVLRIHAL